MIGFVVGTLCLVGLVKVLRHGHSCGPAFAFGGGCGPYGGGYGRGYGGRCYGGRFGGPDGGPEFGGDFGGRWRRHGHHGGRWGGRGWMGRHAFMDRIFERLETTPEQEKVISQALDELRAAGKGIKSEMRGARSELASALRGESFDEVALGGATARIETTVDAFRKAGIDAFAKIHGALDARQRSILADWLERGPRGFGPFGG